MVRSIIYCKIKNCPSCKSAKVTHLERDWDQKGRSMVECLLLVCGSCDNVWEQRGEEVFAFDEEMKERAKKTAGYEYYKSQTISG